MIFGQPEWFIANTGSILAGCIAAGIYSTNTAEACYYVSEHSKAQVIVVEGNKQLAKYANLASPLPHLKAIIVYDEAVLPTIASKVSVPVYSWADFLALGSSVVSIQLRQLILF